MELLDLFYKWVPLYLRLPILLLLFFVILVANGVFLGNINDMYSSLGVYNEPFSAAYNAMYIGMGLGLMIHLRIKLRFAGKWLLLYGLIMMLVMNIVCATTSNATLTIFACFILGIAKISALVEVYIIWLVIWSKKLDTSRLYPFVYFMALAGLYFMTWLTTRLAYDYNWRYAYIWVFILLLVSILLTLLFVEFHPLKKKIPLYQVDWIGIICLGAFMMLVNYIVVYGKVEDWFASKKIVAAIFATVITLMVFVKRELIIKRPVFPLTLFKIANFRMGLLYFVLLGIFIPSTFQSTFSLGILHYETYRNTELSLYMIPGIFLGAVLSYYWYARQYSAQILIILGFMVMISYYIIMYLSFGNDFEMQMFWLPSILKGIGTTVLYIAVGLFITANHKFEAVFTVSGLAILARSFLSSGTFSSLYSYLLYTQRIRHLSYLSGMIDNGNSIFNTAGTNAEVYKYLQSQALLGASKELSGYIIIAGFLIIAGLVIRYVYQKFNMVQ